MSGGETYLPVADGRLRLRDEGSRDPAAPVLVLLHGFSFDLTAWDVNMPALARRCRVVRYDLRGFGASSVPTGPYDHSADLDHVIRSLGLVRPVVVGLSLGANVALGLAARFATPVAGIVLAAPGLPGYPWRDTRPPDAAMAHARDHDIDQTRAFWLGLPLFASLATQPRARDAVHGMVGNYSGWHWKNRDMQIPAPPLSGLLDSVRVPVHILSGDLDAEGYREIAGHLANSLPDATLDRIAGAGHCLNLEAPDAFEGAVLGFVDRTRAGTPVAGGQEMSNSMPFNLDPPGTYVYTGEMATRGYNLTRFGLSLRNPDNRTRFLADEAGYMRAAGLTEAEIAMVRGRDWTGLIQAGGHLQAMLKVAATVGQNLWHIGAHNAGLEVDELMRLCPRNVSALPGGAD